MQYPHVKAFFTTKVAGDGVKQVLVEIGVAERDIYMPVQRHTDTVIIIENQMESEIADAVLTKKKGLLIGVQVADCVPILLFDGRRSVVGAVHAGWRGTASQITRKAIGRMIDCFDSRPEDISVALGPSIKRECYEVGREVKEAICEVMGEGEYCMPVNGKYHIDLPAVNVLQAISAGVRKDNIWVSEVCTHCNPSDFHSYRYHGDHCGRQGGFIGVF
jgi:YfiH family protein